jgi:hypothetical protein
VVVSVSVPVKVLSSSVLDLIKTKLFRAVTEDDATSKLFCRLGCEVSVHKTGYPAFTQVGVEWTDNRQIARASKKMFFLIFINVI